MALQEVRTLRGRENQPTYMRIYMFQWSGVKPNEITVQLGVWEDAERAATEPPLEVFAHKLEIDRKVETKRFAALLGLAYQELQMRFYPNAERV